MERLVLDPEGPSGKCIRRGRELCGPVCEPSFLPGELQGVFKGSGQTGSPDLDGAGVLVYPFEKPVLCQIFLWLLVFVLSPERIWSGGWGVRTPRSRTLVCCPKPLDKLTQGIHWEWEGREGWGHWLVLACVQRHSISSLGRGVPERWLGDSSCAAVRLEAELSPLGGKGRILFLLYLLLTFYFLFSISAVRLLRMKINFYKA